MMCGIAGGLGNLSDAERIGSHRWSATVGGRIPPLANTIVILAIAP